MVYVGRVDDQVKINGFRVELSDVENTIKQEKQITSCAVIAKENAFGECEIYAYIVSETAVNIGEFRQRLLQKIPYYMAPSFIKQIDRIPLTHNGKLDRRSLPKIKERMENDITVTFLNEIEEKLYEIYKKLLNINYFNCETSFFELGGQSLKAIRLIAEIEKVFQCKLTAQIIFELPSVRQLANYIQQHTDETQEVEFTKAAEKQLYDVSSTQNRIYLICQGDSSKLLYNLPRCFVCKGIVYVNKVKKVFETIVERHEILRTSFILHQGKLYQRVNHNVKANFEYVEESNLSEAELISEFVKPFVLAEKSLVRMKVIKRIEDYVMLIDMHHIISDGTSYNNFITEFNMLYSDHSLKPLEYQYKDYSEWMQKRNLFQQRQYWINELGGDIPTLNIPLDYMRQKHKSYRGKTLIDSKISMEFRDNLRKFSIRHGLTEYMVYLAGAMIMLSKYSRQDDITIGSPYVSRMKKETESMIGMFANTLVMRGEPKKEKRIIDFINEIKKKCINAYSNQEYPFDKLVESLGIDYDVSHNPLFDVMLVMENQEQKKIEMGNEVIQEYDVIPNTSKFDLSIYIFDQSDFSIRLEYCMDLFDETSASLMLKHYLDIMNFIVTGDVEQNIGMIEMMSDEEKQCILNSFNVSSNNIVPYVHILDQIEQQIKKNQTKTAIIESDREIIYKELDDRVSYLANELVKRGVDHGDYVGVICKRGIEMVISFLAIMKAGAVYVPMDCAMPEERINYICTDCNPKVVLVQNNIFRSLKNVFTLDDFSTWECGRSFDNRFTEFLDLMYCIYTSGTTGKPKGVLQKISTISNLVTWEKGQKQMTCGNVSLLASPSFDVSVQEISTALAMGCTLVVVSDEIKKDSSEFARYIVKKNVDTVFCTPSYWDTVTSSVYGKRILNQIQIIILAGEAMYLNKQCIASLPLHTYFNHYGPTETHVVTSKIVEQDDQRITIGKPIKNHMALIMNDDMLCGIGEPGELCIAGEGVAIGYHGMPDMTKEKFVKILSYQKRMYRTGDLVRWLPNGEIDYLGRMDNQIKVRGFRVELGEIENVIRSLDDVLDCAVIVKENSYGERDLYAYLTSDKDLDFEVIKNNIRNILPDYMIPTFMMQIAKIPMTINGKLNISELPEIIIDSSIKIKEPTTDTEKIVAKIFKNILRIDCMSIDQDFFELGGHSLKVMKLVNQVCECMGCSITIQDVFNNPTVEKLAELLEKKHSKNTVEFDKCLDQTTYEMSSAQKRIYFVSKLDETGFLYNIPGGFIVKEKLDAERVKYAVKKMIERHEILRTSFSMENGELVQCILENLQVDPEIIVDENADENVELENFIKPFDFTKPPLFRMKVIVRKKDSILLLDMHHIISDGTSYWNFLNDFFALYTGRNLQKPYYQYRDYSEWMRNRDLS